ncbi:hypothetical protein G7054_g15027 [Neopestalotiopsis clavispora]|nr:hypothetical protein G7054_g15027 [Neopestalotiopsis clavispora]
MSANSTCSLKAVLLAGLLGFTMAAPLGKPYTTRTVDVACSECEGETVARTVEVACSECEGEVVERTVDEDCSECEGTVTTRTVNEDCSECEGTVTTRTVDEDCSEWRGRGPRRRRMLRVRGRGHSTGRGGLL